MGSSVCDLFFEFTLYLFVFYSLFVFLEFSVPQCFTPSAAPAPPTCSSAGVHHFSWLVSPFTCLVRLWLQQQVGEMRAGKKGQIRLKINITIYIFTYWTKLQTFTIQNTQYRKMRTVWTEWKNRTRCNRMPEIRSRKRFMQTLKKNRHSLKKFMEQTFKTIKKNDSKWNHLRPHISRWQSCTPSVSC